MIGLVIATHARLAEEFLAACEMIVGPLDLARAVPVRPEDGLEEVRDRMATALEEVGRDGEGVLVVTDMFGGTPANLAISFLDPGKVEVLTGVNLPMLLKFCSLREEQSLAELIAQLKSYGQQSICLASEFLQK